GLPVVRRGVWRGAAIFLGIHSTRARDGVGVSGTGLPDHSEFVEGFYARWKGLRLERALAAVAAPGSGEGGAGSPQVARPESDSVAGAAGASSAGVFLGVHRR